MTPAQVKLALQSGATYVPDGGLMGAGAGSVNFWASRKITGSTGLLGSVLTADCSAAVGGPSGASFWDDGTLATRLYQRSRRPAAVICFDAAAALAESVAAARGRSEPPRARNPLS